METRGRRQKGKKEHKMKRNKNSIKLLSTAELEEIAAIKQGKSKLKVSASDRTQWHPMLFTPNEDNINEANKLSWNIGPFRDAEFKFHDSHPLMILWKFTVQVRRTDDATGKPDLTKPLIDIDMRPEKMGCWPWPATGATGYFSKVRTSYNGFVTNDTEVLHCINLDELNTMASMDMFLNPDEADLDLSKSFGNTPLYNNYGKTMEHLKNQLGYPPDLNYTNTRIKTFPAGYRFAYGKLPCVPFTKFSPRMKKKMAENSGGDTREEVSSLIFPPKTMFRFDFTKTSKDSYFHEFYWPSYTDMMASTQATLPKAEYTYRRFQLKNDDGTADDFCIESVDIDVKKIYLCGFIRKISETLKNRLPIFNTYCTARRLQEIKLDDNRHPIWTYYIDQQSLGLGFVLMFRRELDLERDSSQPHPFSSQTCYRPPSLNRITVLEGGDQGGEPVVFNNMDINNLAYEQLDTTMWKFAENTVQQGWISLAQSRHFWEMPLVNGQTIAKGAGESGNVGVSNYFPVSLLDESIRQNFAYFSSNGLKSNSLQIKLEFTKALTKSWYMLIVSEYLVSLTFDPETGNPSFKVV